jgi:hypothetical protein
MWIFSRYGFYSVTAGDNKKLQIRARNKDHLYNLKDEFPEIFKDRKLIELPSRDYRYRYIVTPEEWSTISEQLMSEVGEYSNFKGECAKRVDNGQLDAKYEHLLHRIWSEHMSYQNGLNHSKGSAKSGALGYTSSTRGYLPSIKEQNSLWRDHQSRVYDADYEDDDHVLDKREANEILADLDLLPSRQSRSLFIDTDIGEVFTADSNRSTGNGKKKKHKR